MLQADLLGKVLSLIDAPGRDHEVDDLPDDRLVTQLEIDAERIVPDGWVATLPPHEEKQDEDDPHPDDQEWRERREH